MERRTRQKEAIEAVFDEHVRPLTPGEIHQLAAEKIPQLGIATVYRFLKALIEEKQIITVEIPGQAPRYERTNKEHHHHFFCRTCGKVFELERCMAEVKKMAPRGFRVEKHDITLYGLCGACAAGDKS